MFGHLPLIIKEIVLEYCKTDKWDYILRKLGLSEDFLETQIYDERLGEQILNEAISVTNISRDHFLEKFGEMYLKNIVSKDNSQVLRLLGSNFYEFVQNLDFLHTTSMAKYPKAEIPLFRIDEDGLSFNRLKLHYYSKREYLSRMVESLLRSIAKTIFKKEIKIEIISEKREDDRYHVVYSVIMDDIRMEHESPPTMVAQTKKHGENHLHDAEVEHHMDHLVHMKMELGENFLPVNQFRRKHSKWRPKRILNKTVELRIPQTLDISPDTFCEIFPYHIIFDSAMNLKQAGIEIQFIIEEFRNENINITNHLEIVHPGHCDFSFYNVQKYINCPHVLKTRGNELMTTFTKGGATVYFRGQMVEISNRQSILYLCSPYISNLNTFEHYGMHISDIPTHDVTKYLFQGCSSIEAFKRRTNRGDCLEDFLGSSRKPIFDTNLDDDLDDHRFAMVPRGIADQMRMGQKVQGELYHNCSILFCDLVHFGLIVQNCSPNEVLKMLNDLHNSFDRLADVNDVFTVDMIGDAYVKVCGIPLPVHNHAERIAKTAIEMLTISRLTYCPYNYGTTIGSRVLIRIGLHCGDVIGGVIGTPVHRFTIIGDNVIMASRMESHGIPDRVHLSQSFYSELKPYKFEMEPRGNIEIRGKGRMYTYLLSDSQQTKKTFFYGERKDKNFSYPLPMSQNSDQDNIFMSDLNQRFDNTTKIYQPRYMRPRSGRDK